MTLVVRRVGAESAAAVHAVVRAAFGARPPLDPPADALAETPDSIGAALAAGGGLLATLEGHPVGALVMEADGRTVWLRRFGVVPSAQRLGVAGALVAEALSIADGDEVAVVAREELPATVDFWRGHGFVEPDQPDQPDQPGQPGRRSPYVELRRAVPRTHPAPDADAMRALGRLVGGLVRAGDLVVLSGELGAGKTTFTQGLGAGLGVRGDVTSPTFVIARVHPSLSGGPALVHADAYRLGGIDELDDLDLDASLDEAVTVVEWGTGIAEGLADSRLEVRIARSPTAVAEGELDPRTVTIVPVGPRWLGVEWP
ncbi:tRNA (adenosine(37)-N6)-threonylcarbamoyltransferase complex ATPase subunit type 1 TsaE [Nocardioides agariphilus]